MRGVEDDMEDDHEGLEPAVGDGVESEEPEEDGTRRHAPRCLNMITTTLSTSRDSKGGNAELRWCS